MAPIKHIFLDVDGVLADFTRSALRIHGCEHLIANWPRGEQDLPKVLGISRTQFWRRIEELGPSFWENLDPYTWFSDLVGYVAAIAPFTLVTAPSLSPQCVSGKVEWIYQRFPKVQGKRFTNFLIGHEKSLLAAPGRILIDDGEENIDAFQQHGGMGVLFPQVWNRGHSVQDPCKFVCEAIDNLRAGNSHA